jgi:pimeloyl-ACP methyl ester carboxylesterase
VYLNTFAPGIEPLDMTATDEFASLVQSARDLGLPAPATGRYVSRNVVVNGLRFHALEWGQPGAPAVLLLHGGNQTAHSWDLVSLALAERFHVVAVDQRGHGDSEWPRDGEASTEAMAADAERIVATLGLRRPVVVGHSMGGLVTMTLLLAHPEIAARAVLVDVGPEVAEEGTRQIRDFVRGTAEFDSLEEFVERVAAYDPYRSREHIARTARYNLLRRADGKYASKHDLRRRLAEVGAMQAPRRLSLDDVRAITCPVLVVRGGDSRVLTAEAAERFAAALPDGRLVTVPRCGHNVHSQNTAGFLDAVLPFLDGASG